jgi:hypothetical protein
MIACMMFIPACSEENERVPATSDLTIPGQVSNIRVERLPGSVKLAYDMPGGQNLSYVKAECMINGVLRRVKASSYTNSLVMEGFADTSVYTINLYSVNRSELASEPVSVRAKPLTPNFQEVFKNIELVRDWGGASAFFDNPNEADLAITLIYVDSTGFWNQGETVYTKKQQGSVSVRGFEPEETKFGVYVRDRWDNMTDTLVKDLIPRFEKQLDRTKFREIYLPSDQNAAWGWTMPHIWDGDIQNNTNIDKPGFHTSINVWPQWFTFDLGVEQGAKLSRFKSWQRGQECSFNDRNIRKFEIWGSMNPNPDGSFDESWTLLTDAESIKPSELPLGQLSEEDVQTIINGEEFLFSLDVPYVRYIRIKVKETWTKAPEFYIMQVAFWGAEPSDDPDGE